MTHVSFPIVAFFMSLGCAACTVQTVPLKGDKGDKGAPGVADTKTLAELQGTIDALKTTVESLQADASAVQSRLDALEAQTRDPDCPYGYVVAAKPLLPANADTVLCKKGEDEMVRVGIGSAAFWIDRFEASVWENPDGTGNQYGEDNNYPVGYPGNGQRTPGSVELFAVSAAGVLPSAAMTWFQAQRACRASGKRLPSGEEWLAAANGTIDPGASDGQNGACVTMAGSQRITGDGVACVSGWGAQDMIGNLGEFTSEWYAAPGDGDGINNAKSNWGKPEYAGDGTWNLVSGASGNAGALQNLPAAAVRGANYTEGVAAGVFALSVGNTPSRSDSLIGVRCARSR